MRIEKIDEKVRAIQTAESCINTILSMNPGVIDESIFGVLAELKLDLMDIKFDQLTEEGLI